MLTLIMVIMFVTRTIGYEKYITETSVLLRSRDPWYHYRTTAYIVEQFPWALPTDPFTGYPTGASSGQFGTLFDQALATVALIVGGGAPSEQTLLLVLLFAPPVLGTLVAIPVYLLGKRIAGGCRWTGVAAAGLLALFPATFFQQSVVGAADHHIAEALLMACAVASFIAALTAAREERPVYEAIRDAPLSARRSLTGGCLTGVFAALLMGIWPPGAVFVAILGVFLTLYTVVSVHGGETPEPVLFVGAAGVGSAGLLMIPQLDVIGLEITQVSLAHVLFPAGIALWCMYLAGLARFMKRSALEKVEYPLCVGVSILFGVGLLYVGAPGVFELVRESLVRAFGLGIHASELQTVGEAQPITYHGGLSHIADEYGAIAGVAVLGYLALLYRSVRYRASEPFFIAVWATLIGLMAMTQVRFNYYFALVVAVLSAYAFRIVINQLNLPWTTDPREVVRNLHGYQVVTVVFIIATVVPVLLFPVSGTVAGVMGSHGATEYQQWEGSLDWVEDNTPQMGELEGASNPMGFNEVYKSTETVDYPEGSYGVMSWWRYGHWITSGSERAAVTNPFQQHVTEAAAYLLATDDDEAQQALTELDDEATARYVMVDWRMAHPDADFLGPVAYHPDAAIDEYVTPLYIQREDSVEYATNVKSQSYYESLMVRLYQYHGSAMDAQPIVVNYNTATPPGADGEVNVLPSDRPLVTQYNSLEAANEEAAGDPTKQVGGIGLYPEERVPALEHYRLIHASESPATDSTLYQQTTQQEAVLAGMSPDQSRTAHPSWVKTFERVPGATVEGTAPANSTVRTTVTMSMPHSDDTFTYTAYADADETGTFELTVPYSTTGSDAWGPDRGYTDTAVTATGPYQFETVVEEQADDGTTGLTRWHGTAHVTEGQVIGEDSSAVTVALTEQGSEDSDASE